VHTHLTGQIWDHFKIKLDHIQAPKADHNQGDTIHQTVQIGRAQKLVATQFLGGGNGSLILEDKHWGRNKWLG
jgi:hypothetical protein